MKRKFVILLLIMILIISVLAVDASALSFTTAMTASSTRVEASTEFTITVKLSNLDVGDSGVNTFSAYISYDQDVFETLNDSNIDGLSGWAPAYAPGTGKVALQKRQFTKTDEEIMQITLKTKAGLAEGTQGEVKLTNIIAATSTDEISASPVSTTITVGKPSSGGTVVPPTNTSSPANTSIQIQPGNTTSPINTSIPNNSSTNVPEPVNNSVVDQPANITDDMPYTGSEGSALSKIIIGVIFIALATYIKIEKMNDM